MSSPTRGQEATDPAVERIEAEAQAIADAATIDPAIKAAAAPIYAAAMEFARAAAASRAAATRAREAAAAAPELLAGAKLQLETQLPPHPEVAQLADLEPAELEARLATARSTSDQTAARLQAKEFERQQRATRLAALPGLIADAAANTTRLEATQPNPIADEPPQITAANATRRTAELDALLSRTAELEAEKLQYEAESTLLIAQRDVLQRDQRHQAALVERLDSAAQERRRRDASDDADTADAEALRVDPIWAEIAAANQSLAAEREALLERRATTDANLKRAEDRYELLHERFSTLQGRVARVRLNDVIGLQLRQEKARLPRIRQLHATIDARRDQLVQVQLAEFDVEDRLRTFREARDELAAAALAKLPTTTSAAQRQRIAGQGERLLQQRQRFFEGLRGDLQAYAETIGKLDVQERKLVEEALLLANFVNERVLWVRSTAPVWETEWPAVGSALSWLTNANNWGNLGTAVGSAFRRNPVQLSTVSLLALLLVLFSRPLRRRITALGEEGSNSRATRFAPTAWTLVLTVIAVSGLPLLLWHTGTQIQTTPGVGEFASSVAGGLAHIAMLYAAADLFRCITRPDGLAEAHLRWPTSRTRLLRRNLAWWLPVILALAFALRALTLHGHAPWGAMLDRLLLIALLTTTAIVLARMLHPARGALAQGNAPMPLGRRRSYYALGIVVPMVLITLAAAGYHFTARELLFRLEASIGVIALAILLYELALRWMLLAKRRLALKQAKALREAAAAKTTDAEVIPSDNPQLVTETINLTTINVQSRKLVGGALLLIVVGVLWAIWGEVLPALRGLNDITLWNVASETTTVVDDRQVTTTVNSAITLWNLLLSLLALSITFAAARNIPGILELAVLQRLRSHAGERAAITTLVRYSIVIVGTVVAFSSLGIEWGKVQWLVAAVSVGLGFGLQEIFANFVSGFIILFERPVRIGDLVTVGDTDGFVTQIKMRATTIVDFDRREMIVPNKEFVTSRLVNWTLTDPITRVILPVGVAYGSDTELARRLLLEAAVANDLVLEDPKPKAIFRGFGDSSLDLELRVFIASRDMWPQLVNSLNTAIDDAFRKHEIEIPFPQRDVHVRTMGPLGNTAADGPPTQ
ncbi:MAG: mechanosensitive ion channel [bacterium]|nr:mechanosensitive ion channel [bacterium]